MPGIASWNFQDITSTYLRRRDERPPVYNFQAFGLDLNIDGKDEVRSIYRNWTDTNQCVFYAEDEQVAVLMFFPI
jgi:hypothetical protein